MAPAVDPVLYTISPESPLYYVTYVEIYGGTETVVYEGYTPGYLGTVVTPEEVVVYGTGYDYDPWIGEVWYAVHATYGVMAQPVYNPAVGYTYGFAVGLATASVAALWASPVYYTTWYHGYPCCGSATANVYRHAGYTSFAGTQTWYAKSDGTYGVKSEFFVKSMKIGKPVFRQMGDALPDYVASDCPIAARRIMQGIAESVHIEGLIQRTLGRER